MKTLKFLVPFVLLISFAQFGIAQSKKETFKVAGACGMCKTKIENAAKSAGATYALWNTDTKELIVKYNSTSSNTAKIQQTIANVGYDTPNFKATDEAYNNLHECCKYDRTILAANCCDKADCCKDGKCTAGAECCKQGDASCCIDGKCKHEAHAKSAGQTCCKKA